MRAFIFTGMRHRTIKGKELVFEKDKKYIVQGDPHELKGKWYTLFGNDNPIYLEIGSGKGQFLSTLARENPEINFLACEGIDDVYIRIVEKCEAEDFKNLRLIPVFMDDSSQYFDEGEIEKVFINFCDPWPKKRHAKRRLTFGKHLLEYGKIMGPGHLIQFKTDNDELFDFTLEQIEEVGYEVIEQSRDLLHSEYEKTNIHTEYEDKFEGFGKNINYVLIKIK